MLVRVAAALFALGTPALASALSLADYQLTGTFALPAVAASEASAVTYNWDTGTLFVLGDEGLALVEVDANGNQLSSMQLTGFVDTEGLAYVGGGQFVITEERERDAYRLSYSAGGSAARSTLASADLGTTIGNIGIEGIAFDARDGSFVLVKEKTPQEVTLANITFGTPGSATLTGLGVPSPAVLDLSDVSVLSGVTALAGTAGADDLLVYSQESRVLLQVTRTGTVLSSFDFSALSLNAEGVTILPDGTIYVVAETSTELGSVSTMFRLSAVPEPSTAALLLAASVASLAMRARGREAAQRGA